MLKSSKHKSAFSSLLRLTTSAHGFVFIIQQHFSWIRIFHYHLRFIDPKFHQPWIQSTAFLIFSTSTKLIETETKLQSKIDTKRILKLEVTHRIRRGGKIQVTISCTLLFLLWFMLLLLRIVASFFFYIELLRDDSVRVANLRVIGALWVKRVYEWRRFWHAWWMIENFGFLIFGWRRFWMCF